ncbi:MAG: histidine kinase [Chloroflexi bacterium]|jgi:K+-sensing histidine kinase KdpD|nr:histidine kinase [Chloroflexota bacterium]
MDYSVDPNTPPTTNSEEDSLREQFFSYIFHELRTPLTVIHSYAQILTTKLPQTPEFNSQRRISEQMVVQGDEMVDMIEELLEASRIPSKRLNLDLIEHNLQELLDSLIERLKEAEGKEITWQAPGRAYTVMVDGSRLERALKSVLNYVLQVEEKAEIRLEEDPATGQVRLLIPAPGLHMTPEQVRELFDLYRPVRREQPFQTDIPKAGSLDISLYVARGLVEGHGGKLDYSQELPGFILTFPLLGD